jgi:UDP-N-acetyl-D-mannosaminuronic acid dehydrogenase
MKKTVTVLGLGYIGLPTALLFAKSGNQVIGVDINQSVVNSLNNGKLHIEEPGLQELFISAKNNFSATTVVGPSDVFLITVPTPLKKSIHVSDLAYVRTAFEMIYPYLKKGDLVILESTVTPGASEKLGIPILERSGLKAGEFFYAHCPERAIPGKTLYEMVHNDRIIGGFNPDSADITKNLYGSYVKGKIFITDIKTAEFSKIIENTYRDVNIALANELAQIAENAGINVWEAIALANKHPRVNILNPGPGVGGHCIAVDPWFLTENSSKWGIIQLARDINDAMPNHVLQLVRSLLVRVKDPVITIFGVAYKGNVDDTRETPALKFIKLAENEGYTVKCYDPHIKQFEYPCLPLEQAVDSSDCIIIITDHDEFKKINPADLRMRRRIILDTRNLLDHALWIKSGFTVRVLGTGVKI